MKEILYIQAGTLPNFVGTHFWNTQESYFQYDIDGNADEADEPEINHDVSFREGLSPKVRVQILLTHSYGYENSRVVDNQGDPTFCPRLLVFDRKGKHPRFSLSPRDRFNSAYSEFREFLISRHAIPRSWRRNH